MNQTSRAVLVLVVAIGFVSAGNLFLSLAGKPLSDNPAIPAWVRSLSGLGRWPLTVMGVCGHAAFFCCWIWVLSKIDLSVAVPITALAPVAAALLGYFLLREPMDALRWLGVVLVVAGVALIGVSAKNNGHAPPRAEANR